MMEKNAKIYIAGHQGMMGSAIHRNLKKSGYRNFILHTSSELDLRNQSAVQHFFEIEKPDYVFLMAARSGGIASNEAYPADFLYDNMMILSNVIHQSYRMDVRRLLHLSSSVVYPRDAVSPVHESSLLSGQLEQAYEAYSISKIAGIKMSQAYNQQHGCEFISAIAADIYGEITDRGLIQSHFIPALANRIHQAKLNDKHAVEVWGTGSSEREFIHADDLADACIFLMNLDRVPDVINIGTGEKVTIHHLAELMKDNFGYLGDLYFNPAKPDVMNSKILDTTAIDTLGWHSGIELESGLKEVCHTYEHDQAELLRNRQSVPH
jgi:GDP-L-fucose synthase